MTLFWLFLVFDLTLSVMTKGLLYCTTGSSVDIHVAENHFVQELNVYNLWTEQLCSRLHEITQHQYFDASQFNWFLGKLLTDSMQANDLPE